MNLNATIFFQVIVFFILCWITTRFVWPPLLRAIQERQKKIEEGLSAAEQGKLDLISAQERIRSLEVSSKIEMQAKIEATEKKALLILEEAKKDARSHHLRMLDSTNEEIRYNAEKAREVLRCDLSNLIIKGAAQILKREIDPRKHSDILEKLKEQL